MKRILTILFILLFATNYMFAQQMNGQRIKLLKTSYITDAINLSPKEAEKFWPVYNLYTDKIQTFRISLETGFQTDVRLAGGIDNLTDSQAQKLVDSFISLEQQITDNEIKLIQELSKIISAKKIIGLKKAEREFNRRILQEYGKRKRMQGQ